MYLQAEIPEQASEFSSFYVVSDLFDSFMCSYFYLDFLTFKMQGNHMLFTREWNSSVPEQSNGQSLRGK